MHQNNGKKERDYMNFRDMPKIDLHCHIDGSIRPSTIMDIAKREGMELPADNIEDFLPYVQAPKECKSLKEYLERFGYPNMVMQSKENIERITYEVMEDASLENVKYIELRFAPLLHMNKGLTFDEIVESAISGLKRAERDFDIKGNLILCCMRHEPVERSIIVVEEGKKFIGKGVVAVDLAGNEHDFAPEIHKAAFDLAKEYGFRITIHAGETGRGENIVKSIELLHAERIGHGVNCKDYEDAYKLVKSKGIPLEMCPTSNVQTKAVVDYKDHPIKDFYNESINVTLNTDNRTVSNIDLTGEYSVLNDIGFFNEDDYKAIYLKSVDACFATEEVKIHLRNLI